MKKGAKRRIMGRVVRVAVTNEHGEILLLQAVKRQTTLEFPGGKANRRKNGRFEPAVKAAKRELFEETGLTPKRLRLLIRYERMSVHQIGACYEFYLFHATVRNPQVRVDGKEIRSARWDTLPVLLDRPLEGMTKETLQYPDVLDTLLRAAA